MPEENDSAYSVFSGQIKPTAGKGEIGPYFTLKITDSITAFTPLNHPFPDMESPADVYSLFTYAAGFQIGKLIGENPGLVTMTNYLFLFGFLVPLENLIFFYDVKNSKNPSAMLDYLVQELHARSLVSIAQGTPFDILSIALYCCDGLRIIPKVLAPYPPAVDYSDGVKLCYLSAYNLHDPSLSETSERYLQSSISSQAIVDFVGMMQSASQVIPLFLKSRQNPVDSLTQLKEFTQAKQKELAVDLGMPEEEKNPAEWILSHSTREAKVLYNNDGSLNINIGIGISKGNITTSSDSTAEERRKVAEQMGKLQQFHRNEIFLLMIEEALAQIKGVQNSSQLAERRLATLKLYLGAPSFAIFSDAKAFLSILEEYDKAIQKKP